MATLRTGVPGVLLHRWFLQKHNRGRVWIITTSNLKHFDFFWFCISVNQTALGTSIRWRICAVYQSRRILLRWARVFFKNHVLSIYTRRGSQKTSPYMYICGGQGIFCKPFLSPCEGLEFSRIQLKGCLVCWLQGPWNRVLISYSGLISPSNEPCNILLESSCANTFLVV